MSQMSAEEFIAAVTAVERRRPRPRPPQPVDAVLNDAQIASMKDRLGLTEEQKPYWQAVEAALREVVWDRRAVFIAQGQSRAALSDSCRPQRLSWPRSAPSSGPRSKRSPISSDCGSTARVIELGSN